MGGNLTTTGLLAATGFWAHPSQAVAWGPAADRAHTTAGGGNYGSVEVGNDGSALTLLRAYSSTLTWTG